MSTVEYRQEERQEEIHYLEIFQRSMYRGSNKRKEEEAKEWNQKIE